MEESDRRVTFGMDKNLFGSDFSPKTGGASVGFGIIAVPGDILSV